MLFVCVPLQYVLVCAVPWCLSVVRCVLFVVVFWFVVRCSSLLSVGRWLLHVANCFVLVAVCWLWFVVCCLLVSAGCWLMAVVCCLLFFGGLAFDGG